MSDALFRRRTLVWIALIGSASFVAAIALSIFGGEVRTGTSADANAYSYSAIGHKALVETLRELDVPVVVSEHESATRASGAGVLVIAEPVVFDESGPRAGALREMVVEADAVLLVLPKWYGRASVLNPTWVDDVSLLLASEVETAARIAGIEGEIVRPAAFSPADAAWKQPTLVAPQLIRSADLIPLIHDDQGILLGEYAYAGRTMWVLSDPDLLNNHGLVRGDNAMIALDVLDRLRNDGAVIVDATLHGFAQEPSLWRALFEFPMVLTTLAVLVTISLLLWAAIGRFGKPVPPAPAIEPGKRFLINNTAALLEFGGHADHALRRYLTTTARDVADALHAPPGSDTTLRRRWLDRIAEARGAPSLSALEREVDEVVRDRNERARKVVATAHRIHRWRQEMTHGIGEHSQRR